MNTCLCKRPKKGPPRCRDPQVGVEDGELYCGTTFALACATRPADDDAPRIDIVAIVKAMRAAGWRVEPPKKVRA